MAEFSRMNSRVIFLIGLPRSGTTWLGKIFDSHPDTVYRHEPDSVRRIVGVPLLIDQSEDCFQMRLYDYTRGILTNRASKVVAKKPLFPKSYLSQSALIRYKIGASVVAGLSRFGIELPVPGAPSQAGNGQVVVWKSIESLGRLHALVSANSGSRGLHVVRHPCGYVNSVLRGECRQRFDDNSGASEDYGILEQLLQTPVGEATGFDVRDLRKLSPEERLAFRWAVFNDQALLNCEGNQNISVFAYETLCNSPDEVARQLLELTGLTYEAEVSEFVALSTTSHDGAYYSVYRNPARAAWSWREDLDADVARRVIALAGRSLTWKRLYDDLPDQVPPEGAR
jgi:hypothetical protein